MFAGLTIAVGSGSAIKLAAVRAAFPEAASVEGYGVPSGVADQPSGAGETQEGALNRARGAKEACPGADMWIAFENGMVRAEREGEGKGEGDGDGEGDGERGPHEGWVDRAAATIITKDDPDVVTTVWSKDLAIPADAVAACMHDDGSVTVWSELKDPHGEVDPARPRKVFLCECLQEWRKSIEGDGGG